MNFIFLIFVFFFKFFNFILHYFKLFKNIISSSYFFLILISYFFLRSFFYFLEAIMVQNVFNLLILHAVHSWEFTLTLMTIKVCFFALYDLMKLCWYIFNNHFTKITRIFNFTDLIVFNCFVIFELRLAGFIFAFKFQVV